MSYPPRQPASASERIASVSEAGDPGLAVFLGSLAVAALAGLAYALAGGGDPTVGAVLAATVGLIWLLVAGPRIVRWRLRRRLALTGVRTLAAVGDVSYAPHGDGSPGWIVRYRYRVGDRLYAGTRHVDGDISHLRPGTRIRIAYDPDRPSRSGWLETDG